MGLPCYMTGSQGVVTSDYSRSQHMSVGGLPLNPGNHSQSHFVASKPGEGHLTWPRGQGRLLGAEALCSKKRSQPNCGSEESSEEHSRKKDNGAWGHRGVGRVTIRGWDEVSGKGPGDPPGQGTTCPGEVVHQVVHQAALQRPGTGAWLSLSSPRDPSSLLLNTGLLSSSQKTPKLQAARASFGFYEAVQDRKSAPSRGEGYGAGQSPGVAMHQDIWDRHYFPP